MFPPRSGATADPLGGPPPSPTGMNPDGMGTASVSLRGMAGAGGPGSIPAAQLPPEILTGITQAATQIAGMLDSFTQATPDKAPLLDQVKALLQQYLAELLSDGATAVTPTAAGAAFPGGGIPRGLSGGGAI